MVAVVCPHAIVDGVTDAGEIHVWSKATGEALATIASPTPTQSGYFGKVGIQVVGEKGLLIASPYEKVAPHTRVLRR